ncbi:hypothetical protein AG1IA_09714 [Rhizoctonia solani AG-1 IA]|uniref:Uncharacterized protein n=1 Tax=Thanatephorus cucumeris (strain AG1-IA) TaxID=983506 RepID=L8WDK0_THACA|nr:hypothetical protein AG1IA_09714 [Rhizoctonia solani AG-1 IA]
MSPPMFSACLSFYQVYDEQCSSSQFPRVISSQPTPRSGMVIVPLPAGSVDKYSSGAERLRGNRGADGQRSSPLEPQPVVQIPPPDASQATKKAPEANQPAKLASTRVPRLSEPTPPSHTARAIMASTVTVSVEPSLMPPRAGAVRNHSSPNPPKLSPVSRSATSRQRHTTLPSNLVPPQQAATSSTGPPLEGPIHYPGGTIRNPAFPPSVYNAGGVQIAPSGSPPAPPPFMKD